MDFRDLDADTVDQHISNLAPTEFIGAGGQKRVFMCKYLDGVWALPLILVSGDPGVTLDGDDSGFGLSSDQVIARLRREVAIMRKCDSPHLVKMGPLDVTPVEIENLSILYFLEEYIDGDNLKNILAVEEMSIDDIKDIGVHVTRAIDALWGSDSSQQIIHRDLKPANIMRRASTGEYVVLDVGCAFDVLDDSISHPGQIPGTPLYQTPDQIDHARKGQMDFRTDMFALGVILYEAATGRHPFYSDGMTSVSFLSSLLHGKPKSVCELRPDVPVELGAIIMRLLSKKPHLRYRSCEALLDAFDEI